MVSPGSGSRPVGSPCDGVASGMGEGNQKGLFVDQGRRWRAWTILFPDIFLAQGATLTL